MPKNSLEYEDQSLEYKVRVWVSPIIIELVNTIPAGIRDIKMHIDTVNSLVEVIAPHIREEMKAILPKEAVYDAEDNMNHKDGRIYGTKDFVIGYNDCLKEIKERIEG